jgi:uncharacterized protein YhaN
MKIDRIHIDGFGDHGATSLPAFETPVTILYGPNEAGKSTLLAFIRTVLFGFPLRGAADHFPPRAGGNHGGRIELVTDASERFTVERHRGKKGGPVTVTAADGSPVPGSALSRLLGHAPASTFKSVFAFDLDDLRELESEEENGINSRIYSAGTGAARLPRALKQLKERADEIYAPRGSKQPVARLLAELQQVESALSRAQAQSQEYGDAVSRTAALADEVAAHETQAVEARAHVEELRRRQRSWDQWVALLDVETRLGGIPAGDGFPDDPFVRLDKLEARRRDADELVTAADEKLTPAREQAERPVEGEALVDDAAAVEAIRRGRGGFDASVRDLPKREAELDAELTKLTSGLSQLGPGWDEARLATFDTSMPRRDVVAQWKVRLASARDDVRERAREADQASQRFDEAGRQVEAARERLAKHAQKDAGATGHLAPDVLRARRSALPTARSRLVEFDQATQRQKDLEAQSVGESGGARTTEGRRLALPGVLAALGVLLLAAGLASDQDVTTLLAGAALVVGAIAAYALGSSPRSAPAAPDRRGLQRLVKDARGHAEERRAALAAALEVLVLDLAPDQLPDHDQLNAVEAALAKAAERHQEGVRLQTALDEAEQDTSRLKDRADSARRVRDERKAAAEKEEAGWSGWLGQQELPETLTPDTVPELFSRVETARVVAQAADEKRSRIAAIQKDIDTFSADVKRVADAHLEVKVTLAADDAPLAVAQAADRLVERFDQVRQAVAERKTAVQAAEECEASLAQATTRRRGEDERIRELLSLAETDDAEEFRRRARQHLERQELERTRQQHLSSLRGIWGPEQDLDALRAAFASTTKEETDEALRQAESTFEDVTGSSDQLKEERGSLQLRMKQLSSDEDASRQRGRREELVEALRVQAAEWSKLVVARALLVRARKKYEEERQPDVVRRAQTFFHGLTGGRYPKLHVTVGEQEISVVDETGVRKTPEQLSRGTYEQLYLALRFGLIQSMGEESERLPVIVDEVLVNFDPVRAQHAAAAFAELSHTNQVLVLTCHPWMVDLFKDAAPNAALIDLSTVRTAP